MREIKFMAWDKNRKKILSVAEICFNSHKIERPYIIPYGVPNKIDLDDVELMEYTGRKYQGEEVYEGYIIKSIAEDYTEPLEVFWDEQLDGFAARSLDDEHLYQTPLPADNYKVIGNIFESEKVNINYTNQTTK